MNEQIETHEIRNVGGLSGTTGYAPKIGFFRHIVRGCGNLPHCGEHPGTPMVVMLTAMGAIAGAKGGWMGALGGAGIMLVTFGAMYLCGAYDRSKTDEQIDLHNKVDIAKRDP